MAYDKRETKQIISFCRSHVMFELSCFCGVLMYFGASGLGCLFVPELVCTRLYRRRWCWMHTIGVNTAYLGNSSCLKAGASSPGGPRHVLACFDSLLSSQKAYLATQGNWQLIILNLEEVLDLASVSLYVPWRLPPRSSIQCHSITQTFIR